jgi:hypothetical protein
MDSSEQKIWIADAHRTIGALMPNAYGTMNILSVHGSFALLPDE